MYMHVYQSGLVYVHELFSPRILATKNDYIDIFDLSKTL